MSNIKNVTIVHINPNQQAKSALETYYKNTYPTASFEICDLSNVPIKDCIGCWNCWVKTPGICIHKDALESCYSPIINSDICVFSHDIKHGFLSGRSKTSMDRLIPLFHPYIKIVNNEMMHYQRYDKIPQMHFAYALAEGSKELTPREIEGIKGYYFRCNEHFKTIGQIHHIAHGELISIDTTSRIEPLMSEAFENLNMPSAPLDINSKIVIYNGSPRGKASNSSIIVEEFKKGLLMQGILENQIEIYDLNQTSKHKEIASSFYEKNHHLFFMPLYVHSMPGVVKLFLDSVVDNNMCADIKNPPKVGFFVQSGFKEGYQSFYLRGILENLCIHNNWIFAGCGIKGGMEGLHHTPPQANVKIYKAFNNLGLNYAQNGHLSSEMLNTMIKPIFLTNNHKFIFSILPNFLIQFHWNSQLRKNKAMDKVFAKPYKRQSAKNQ